ncbi:hypothetical protein BKA64DRAFT_661900 [Cadophora sp. MPI-SDFR-AT-0126]|nr:hypothetical protein BKA64DRAFT_661900 [Leotiomycetes sp. MPI-SDFR-AT-0126]
MIWSAWGPGLRHCFLGLSSSNVRGLSPSIVLIVWSRRTLGQIMTTSYVGHWHRNLLFVCGINVTAAAAGSVSSRTLALWERVWETHPWAIYLYFFLCCHQYCISAAM